MGMTYAPPSARVDRLEEAVPIIKRLLPAKRSPITALTTTSTGASAGVPPSRSHGRRSRSVPAGRECSGWPPARRTSSGLTPGFNERLAHLRQATEKATAEKIADRRAAAGDRFERLEINLWVSSAGLVGSGNSLLGSARPLHGEGRRLPSTAVRTSSTARSRECAIGCCGAATNSASATTRSRAGRWSRWRRWSRPWRASARAVPAGGPPQAGRRPRRRAFHPRYSPIMTDFRRQIPADDTFATA
jgi:hypothetical protein